MTSFSWLVVLELGTFIAVVAGVILMGDEDE